MFKNADMLTEKDFQAHPVWQFVDANDKGELSVRPVKALPSRNLDGKLVGCRVSFANGSTHFAMLGNINSENHRQTEHFLTLSIWKEGKWFHLSRYFDPDLRKRGPDALSKFVGLKKSDIFPVSYDLRKYSKGVVHSLVGNIEALPKEKLSRKEIIALAVP